MTVPNSTTFPKYSAIVMGISLKNGHHAAYSATQEFKATVHPISVRISGYTEKINLPPQYLDKFNIAYLDDNLIYSDFWEDYALGKFATCCFDAQEFGSYRLLVGPLVWQ